jgi:hypothetical protein
MPSLSSTLSISFCFGYLFDPILFSTGDLSAEPDRFTISFTRIESDLSIFESFVLVIAMTAHSRSSSFRRNRLPRARSPPLALRGNRAHLNRPHALDTFRASIQAFVTDGESHPGFEYHFSHLLTQFSFQRRRLYDALCVLSVVGCCEKRLVDSVLWLGLTRIPIAFQNLQLDVGAHLSTSTLDSIIGSNDIVGISALTSQLVLCFLVLRMDTLDIRHIGRYLSRQTLRHKSTLCKLYQITHILEAAGIVRRSRIPSQLRMAAAFFKPVDIQHVPGSLASDYSIDALLKHTDSTPEGVLQARRDAFFLEAAREYEDPEHSDSA